MVCRRSSMGKTFEEGSVVVGILKVYEDGINIIVVIKRVDIIFNIFICWLGWIVTKYANITNKPPT